MQELNDEYCEVLEAVRIDCHRHRLNAGLGPQLDLEKSEAHNQERSFSNKCSTFGE